MDSQYLYAIASIQICQITFDSRFTSCRGLRLSYLSDIPHIQVLCGSKTGILPRPPAVSFVINTQTFPPRPVKRGSCFALRLVVQLLRPCDVIE